MPGGIVFEIGIPELTILREHWASMPVTLKEMVKATLFKSAITTQGIARLQAPVKTGRLRNSIDVIVKDTKAVIFTNVKYGVYVHQGTGIYGPQRQPIVPVKKKIMATTSNPGWGTKNAAGYYIIGKSVKGQKANPFMERASKIAAPLVLAEFRGMQEAFIKEMAK